MSLIGLELNDAGILAAGGSPPRLLDLDGPARESPGFALPQKTGLLVGKTAEGKAHLFPRQILTRFWDQLNTEPLEQTGKYFPLNHAEIVYRHLALIWQQIQNHGDQIVMAVPGFYEREHLGLLLGIAQELGMPVKGFVPLSLAASSQVDPDPKRMLLYLDIYLHRIEVTYLEQGDNLTVRDCATTAEKGLLHLHRKLVDMIAQEFVRTTRFDPFHQAASEQQLYDRLPGVLSHFQHNTSMDFEIIGGTTPYSITLDHDRIVHQAESVYSEILRLITRMQNKRGRAPLALQLSHRLARLPGCREMLAKLKDTHISELDRGAAARGLPQIWHRLAAQGNNQGISFFTSRPRQPQQQTDAPWPLAEKAAQTRPTHLLYRGIAYPITENPLTIGCSRDNERNHVTIIGATAGVSPSHCTIKLRGNEILLTNVSDHGTLVDDKRIIGNISLKIGQTIRVGTPGEQLQVILCLNSSPEK